MRSPRRSSLSLLALLAAAGLSATCGGSSGGGGAAPAAAGPTVVKLDPGADLEFRAQEALVTLRPNTIVEFPAGRYEIRSELIVNASHVTLRGAGIDQTILDFSNQDSGAQGIHGLADVFTVEDMTLENVPGDGVKVEGVDHVTFRRVKVIWTGGPSEFNGAYGLYPVQCTNVLIEDCHVSGASDAGIYVGQSENIIVRGSTAEFNVAGIEIENSVFADVYENLATNNTGGILVFDLPNLQKQGGRQTRVFNNRVIENNTPNFAPEGNIVGVVPAGTGVMVMANDDIEVFDNEILGNETTGVVVISYLVTGIPITDPAYDPIPTRLNIHDNTIEDGAAFSPDDGEFGFLLNLLFLTSGGIVDMVYDGMLGDQFPGGLPDDERICMRNNVRENGSPATFANLRLAPTELGIPLPTGPLLFDLAPHDCAYDPLPAIVLDEAPAPPPPGGGEPDVITLCAGGGAGVNFGAAEADCPRLADYRLFEDPTDPRKNARAPGIPFDLTTPLFSDYAAKYRFVFLPPGASATYDAEKTFNFPVGTIIAKTFSFHEDFRAPDAATETVVETRLLIRRADGWIGRAYIWDEARTEATLALGGGRRDVSFVDFSGSNRAAHYDIPNANQCATCHFGGAGAGFVPIGPKARYLNRDLNYPGVGVRNQLAHWAAVGALSGAPGDPEVAPRVPVWNDPADGTLQERARGYLEINCAHCHSATGRARFSGLFLNYDEPLGTSAGLCKPPVAAGRGAGDLRLDIVPGHPEQSILAFRMASAEPGVEMPELAKSLVHNEGVSLVSDWISSLPGSCAP